MVLPEKTRHVQRRIVSDSESVEDNFQQRDPKYLDRNFFDPVWVPGDENLSGDFPEELHQLVGLGPTRKLEDRLEAVPLGTSIAGFLINRYVDSTRVLPSEATWIWMYRLWGRVVWGIHLDARQRQKTKRGMNGWWLSSYLERKKEEKREKRMEIGIIRGYPDD